ncbi:MAG TPA: sugar ABC transporter ATP-binding protein [Spirochaetia bacterium]
MDPGNILETVKLCKSYPGVQALDSVDFDLRFGEVQALVGQNGAGKSTLIEIIAGSLRPDSGVIRLGGRELTSLDPWTSIAMGVQTVHQDNQLVDELTVAENIYLFDLPQTRLGFVRQTDCLAASEKLLGELGIDISPRRKLKELTFIEKKLVSVAKAFSRSARILILDEPTASLDERGKNTLFRIIRAHTDKGLSVIYISHNLGEIFEICSRVTVMVDGRKVDTSDVRSVSMNDVVHRMIGRSSTSLYCRDRGEAPAATGSLEVVDFSRRGVVDHVSFTVKRGEIFGIGGLVGSGRTELARMIFGLDRKESGRLLLDGRDITPRNPNDAIRKGIGFLTEDRKSTGLVTKRPIFENISLALFARSPGPFMNLGRERAETDGMSRKLAIKTPSVAQRVINLSGGNQQKVVLGKWLFAESEVLIFDEPTVGIDVGAKSEIYRMMGELACQGKIIVMISSDNPELIAVSDRVGIMRGGRLETILEGARITEENILRYALGVDEGEESK